MLTSKQFSEIKEYLEKAQDPIFFFDNDADGLASFLLLRRWLGRGKGVLAKSFREFTKSYLKRVEELGGDYIFVLDKPDLTQEFVDEINKKNLPLVIIDHHDVPRLENLEFYYNTFEVSGKSEPVSRLCYEVTKQKKDMWISVVGCISDCYIPDFLEEFRKENPDLIDCDYKTAFDIRYKCAIGKLIDIFNYGLKDTTTNVIKMVKFLLNVSFPSEVLEENSKTQSFLKKYYFFDELITKLISKSEKEIKNNFLFFTYGGSASVSQQLSDKLMYRNPEVVIVVGYKSGGGIVKFSLRGGIDIRKLTLKAIENIEGATGGGHKHATGAQVFEKDVEKFREILEKELKL